MWRGAASSSSPMIHPTTEFASVLHVSTRNMNRQMPCLAKDGNKGPFLSLAHRRKSRRCQDYFAIRNDPGRMARRRPGTRARTSICPSVRCRRIRSSRIFAAAASHSRSPKNEQCRDRERRITQYEREEVALSFIPKKNVSIWCNGAAAAGSRPSFLTWEVYFFLRSVRTSEDGGTLMRKTSRLTLGYRSHRRS